MLNASWCSAESGSSQAERATEEARQIVVHPPRPVGLSVQRAARLQFFAQYHEAQLLQLGRGDVRHDVAIERDQRLAHRHVRIGHLERKRTELLRNPEHFAIQRSLVAEVVVDAGNVDVGEPADFARRRTFIAFRRKNLQRSANQTPPRVGLLEIGRSVHVGNLVTTGRAQ